MRWTTAFLLFSLVCSAVSTEPDDEQPSLRVMAKSTVYNAGDTKAIFCKGSNLGEEKIEWYSPTGKVIKEKSSVNTRIYVERKNEAGKTLVPLIIHSIQVNDSGNWTCKAGEQVETISILVGEKVVIKNPSVTMDGEEGKSVKMDCEAKGSPIPVVQWYKDGTPIIDDGTKYRTRNNNDNYVLEVRKLSHLDSGEYICKIRQKALSHYAHKTVMLNVQHKPIMTYTTMEVYAILNETKNITCSAIANPPPTYTWYRRKDGYDTELKLEEDSLITSEDGESSVMVLRMYNSSDLGQYKCAAKNGKGQTSIIFDVSLGNKPETPDFVNAVFSNSSHITFNITCSSCNMTTDKSVAPNPRNLPVIGYSFQLVPVQKDYPPDWDAAFNFNVDIDEEMVNDTLFDVGPLPNTTEFHARVCSRNAAGSSEWVEITPNPLTTDHAIRLMSTITLLIAAYIFTYCF